MKYARRFSISPLGTQTLVCLFGNRNNNDTTACFVLSREALRPKAPGSNRIFLQVPCKRIIALSSIYASMFYELGALEQVVAIDNIDYVNNAAITGKFDRGGLAQVARTAEPDVEQVVRLDPDILFTFGMGTDAGGSKSKLDLTKIPVAISVDHLEETPLARAEWIKFFAAFVDRSSAADSIFDAVEKNYMALKTIAADARTKPAVFSETKYGDVWYMPGGRSNVASLLKDAGAKYLWDDNNDFGSLPLSFEQVYARAREGDFWINLPLVRSKKELAAFEARYTEFKAFKTDAIFNNTKVTNKFGYSIYWETGMIHPERILSDLVQIFHPELKPQIKNELYYYQQLP